MKHFSFSCQGESHKSTDKPCQDSSYSYSMDDVSIAIVCDGHGGDRYFRSDVGARCCVKIAEVAIKQFTTCIDKELFIGKPFTQRKALDESDSMDKLNNADKALRQLFSSIIFAWNNEIEQYTNEYPPTEDEIEKVEPKYIESLKNKTSLEKIYGCTLMAYVHTKDYWFAFHIGDGKCISLHNDEPNVWKEPIPWDDRCFLNKTTSICDSAALDEFRYCYQGDGKFPAVIFLGSDGMDDSFGPIENLVDFYMEVSKLLAKGNDDKTMQELKETLPILSRKGSQDDMSLAYVYDLKALTDMIPKILSYQIGVLENKLSIVKNKIVELKKRSELLSHSTEQKDVIERNYAIKDIEKYSDEIKNTTNRLNHRKEEYNQLKPGSYTIKEVYFTEEEEQDIKIDNGNNNLNVNVVIKNKRFDTKNNKKKGKSKNKKNRKNKKNKSNKKK